MTNKNLEQEPVTHKPLKLTGYFTRQKRTPPVSEEQQLRNLGAVIYSQTASDLDYLLTGRELAALQAYMTAQKPHSSLSVSGTWNAVNGGLWSVELLG